MEDKIKSVLKNDRYKCLRPEELSDFDNSDLSFRDLNNTSLGFNTGTVEKTIDFFFQKFNLSNKEQFTKKFIESISGDGNELSKNNALHSSSLCALLFFYNIKNKPIEYNGVKYDDAFFEVKNKVIRNPSNMDVVLTGKDKNGKESILFIECKFSEFLGTRSYKLGEGYKKEPYKHIFDEFNYEKQSVFQYGLKQLVAHYIGICNFIEDNPKYKKEMSKYYKEGDDRIGLYRKFDNVSFIEVVYEFKESNDYQTYLNETKLVFDALEKENIKTNTKINLLGTTTYQVFFKDNLECVDDKVLKFYNIIK